jgi:hypothetical protein
MKIEKARWIFNGHVAKDLKIFLHDKYAVIPIGKWQINMVLCARSIELTTKANSI